MKTFTITESVTMYSNFGQHAEQNLAYHLTGEIRRHDRVAYDKGSDIPEYNLSVKSSAFTLMSGTACMAQDFNGIIDEYFSKVASKHIAYVTKNFNVFVMNLDEFKSFLYQFARLEKDSEKNGGRYKVKMRKETSAMCEWLMARA